MIDIMLLGTGAMLPLPERYLSALQFRVGSHLHLIDCGEGTQVAMREHHWGFKRLDSIFFTHFHADHVAGLPGLLHTIAHAGKTDPLEIVGPKGTYDVVAGLCVIAWPMPFEVRIREIETPEQFETVSGLICTPVAGEHRAPVLAYRFDLPRQPGFDPERARALGVPLEQWSVLQRGESVIVGEREIQPEEVTTGSRPGTSFGFATDTRPVPAIREAMAGVDLLVAEGTYGDDADADRAAERGHMTFREAATLARDCEAGALWLTHFGVGMTDPAAWRQNAAEVFPAVQLGYAGLQGSVQFDKGYQSGG